MKMTKYFFLILSLFVLFSTAGCGSKAEEAAAPAVSAPSPSASASTSSKTVDVNNVGSVRGKIAFEGVVPEAKELQVSGNPECAVFHPGGKIKNEQILVKDGGLQNVFVYVKSGLEGYQFPAPTSTPMISNKDCVYVPHVIGAQVNQPITIVNEDATLHNVHAHPKINTGWNLGLPFKDAKKTKTFSKAEVAISVKCDVHPWMAGYIAVVDNPCFAVSTEGGSFDISGIPAGKYTIEAWHEKLGTQTQEVTIESGKPTELNFSFKQS